MTETLFLALPMDPERADAARAWWLVGDELIASGNDAGWRERTAGARVVGIADPAHARLVPLAEDARGNPQLAGKALIEARRDALGDDVIAVRSDDWIALGDRELVDSWKDWAQRHDASLDAIVPLASLLPHPDGWHRMVFGNWTILFSRHRAIPDEAALASAVVGDEPVTDWEGDAAALLVSAARRLPASLLPRARRRWSVDRARLRLMGMLAGALLVALLAMPIVEMLRWNGAADRLDAQSVATASRALGRDVTIEEAEGAMRAERVMPHASAGAMLAALTQAMSAEPTVTARTIDYSRGRLTVALTAPDPQALQRLADLLQRQGWRLAVQQTGAASGNEILLDMDAL